MPSHTVIMVVLVAAVVEDDIHYLFRHSYNCRNQKDFRIVGSSLMERYVYNVTNYLDDHPCGDDVLVNATVLVDGCGVVGGVGSNGGAGLTVVVVLLESELVVCYWYWS
ncbi:hypothetical protein C5167_008788 [Papaver somniferum]|uniref:Cytochrome b5 heme-binding domain-containing protein n=1 Tax=Papaver somniferum TaxID=3469 RepID=A0A4Y7JZH9_PAPSO|nr:hypothetical protein C5167_008788 [Papaver somniferum]